MNAHWYSKATYSFKNSEGDTYKPNDEIPVTIKVEKLNPYAIVYVDTKVFSKAGEEQTFLRFYVNAEGNVTKKNVLAKPLVMPGTN